MYGSDVKDLVRAYLHTTLPQYLHRQSASLPSAPLPAVLGKRRMTSSSGQAFTPLVRQQACRQTDSAS